MPHRSSFDFSACLSSLAAVRGWHVGLIVSVAAIAACSSSEVRPGQGDMGASIAGANAAGIGAVATAGSTAGTAGASYPGRAGSNAGAAAGRSGAQTSGTAGSSAAAGSGGQSTAGSSGAPSGSAGTNPGAAGAGSGAGTSGANGSSGSGGNAATAGASGAAGMGGMPTAGKKFVGNITTGGQVRDDFAMFWDQITPENEGKWGSVEPTRDQMNWAGLDRIHDYAKAHNIVFKHHNFVWGSQQPNWLANLSKDEQKAEVEEWIRLFCERYPDVALIDVVNEPPPHTTPVYMDALGGAGQSGYDWIVQSFKWARQYCPNAILILNDYNNIEYGGDNTRFVDIVTKIKAAGAPIDAIGCQAHDAFKLSNDVVKGFIDKLAATGLPLYITEYDIDQASDADQQKVMQTQFPLFWNDDRIKGITLWGYVTGKTWKPNTGLMTDSGMKRPAMTWLLDFLKK